MFKLRPTPYVASLRVYELIENFGKLEQNRWVNLKTPTNSKEQEQINSLIRSIKIDLPVSKYDGVHILEVEDKKYYCPWSTLNRCFSAFYDFKSSLPKQLFKYFIQEKVELIISDSAEIVLDKVAHIKSETWNIPPRWFGLFRPDERIFGHNEMGAFTLIRTDMRNARKRCKYMHKVVLGTFGVGPIEQEIRELLDWLNVFSEDSYVELDYGGLAVFMERILQNQGEGGLISDTSIEDLQKSLAGLASADGNKAGQGYERLISRWRKIAAYEQAV